MHMHIVGDLKTHLLKNILTTGCGGCSNLTVLITSQYILISNHPVK